jgi:aminopeptidase N
MTQSRGSWFYSYIATTLFAPYHARRAFPCFDEPSFRATYDITIGHSTKYHAMSNADIIASRPM